MYAGESIKNASNAYSLNGREIFRALSFSLSLPRSLFLSLLPSLSPILLHLYPPRAFLAFFFRSRAASALYRCAAVYIFFGLD